MGLRSPAGHTAPFADGSKTASPSLLSKQSLLAHASVCVFGGFYYLYYIILYLLYI